MSTFGWRLGRVGATVSHSHMDSPEATHSQADAADAPASRGPPGEMPSLGALHTVPAVPDYDLIRRIGDGGYGEVWLARSVATGALRAAKIVWRHKFEDDRPFRREFEGIQRFEKISREHPGQLALFHIGRNDAEGYFYYVMELADDAGGVFRTAELYVARTLRADLEHGRLSAERVVEIGLVLAEAIGHLHKNGLVHRDVKPSNVIFVNGRPKLADIGLVTDASDQCSIVGTEGYLPPEGPGTPQADIFAFGKVLYEAAMGMDRRNFPELPEGLRDWPDARQVIEINEILLKACAKDSRTRYATAELMLDELRLLESGKSVKTKRARQWYRAMAARAAVGLMIVGSLAALVSVRIRERGTEDSTSDGPDSTNRLATALCDKAMEVIRSDTYQQFGEAYTNLHRAIDLDRGFARPYVGLLEFRLRDAGPFTKEESVKAFAAKLKLLGPRLGATATAQAITSYFDWDYPTAERYALQAIHNSPRYELAHTWYGFMLCNWGRLEESRAQLTNSMAIRPSKAIIYRCIGDTFYVQRNFIEATNWYQKAIDLDGHNPYEFLYQSRAQWALQDYATSIKTKEQADLLGGEDPSTVSNRYVRLRKAFLLDGKRGFWEELSKESEFSPWRSYVKAKVQVELGDKDKALALLQYAFENNEGRGEDGGLGYLIYDESWDGLRDDRSFKKLLDQMTYTKVMRPKK